MSTKYPEGYFKIPYTQSFYNKYIGKTSIPQSIREASL